MTEPLGTMEMIDGKLVLRFERRLAHPPERVWRAVTDPTEMAQWFPATVETELVIGARMRFSFGDDAIDLDAAYADGEIIEFDPPKVYAFRWADSVLRFELVAEEPGCRLVFAHALSGTGTNGDRPSVARQAPGWDGCLAMLVARLDGRSAPQLDGQWFLERAERYVDEFGLAQGELRELGDAYVVRFERDLVPSSADIWSLLVGEEKPQLGAPPPARCTHGYLEPAEVTALDPGRVLEFEWWHDNARAGRVRFELRDQEPIGTRFVVTQTLPRALADLRATALAAWQTHLELFFAASHGEVRCPWPAERTAALRARYAEQFGSAACG